MATDFDGVKIGVCDAFWTPLGGNETYLGLTKGGVELTYTPEWHDITVDQYGKTPVDEVLVGETISIKIPLAETDLTKLKMFAHTGTWNDTTKKLTFGQYPGLRLSTKAGKLRLHPIAFGADTSEDVTIYRAVNKGQLQLAYKMDEERIFQTEFVGMIVRNNSSGSFLWEIGDSSSGLTGGLKPDLSNLEPLFQATGNTWAFAPTTLPDIYGTPDTANSHFGSTSISASCLYNFQTYPITSLVNYQIGDAKVGAIDVVTTSGGTTKATNIVTMGVDSNGLPTGVLTAADTTTLTGLYAGSTQLVAGDTIVIPITMTWAGQTYTLTINVIV